MSGPDMGEDKINMILAAINEITDNVRADIDKKLEDGLKNKDINEPFNQEAVQEEYKPTRYCIQFSISK